MTQISMPLATIIVFALMALGLMFLTRPLSLFLISSDALLFGHIKTPPDRLKLDAFSRVPEFEMNMIDHLKIKNNDRWQQMKIDPECSSLLNRVAERLCGAKQRYITVSEATTVPWFIIAVIHYREASQSWLANIAQGDPWNMVSKHVPRGQGPFNSWEAAAENALRRSPPFAAQWKDWSPGGALTLLELYNGLGYANRELPSPYVWAATNQYSRGKYIADGHFDPLAIDHQLGCAALIASMALLDHSVKFT